MLKNYLKLAIKVLLRRKFFTFISLFGICLTLLVLIVATALIDHLLATNPPEQKLDRILGVYGLKMKGPRSESSGGAGYEFLDKYLRRLENRAEAITIIQRPDRVAAYNRERKFNLFIRRTDAEFWHILDFEFVEGKPWTAEDARDGRYVAVINESTRDRFFGGESALGKRIDVDGQRFTVTGVVRDVSIIRIIPFSDVWVPVTTSKSSSYLEGFRGGFQALVLAKSKADFPILKEEFDQILETVQLPDPENYDTLEVKLSTRLEFIAEDIFGLSDAWVLVALSSGLVLLFMLLPAINLVNLNLSRILERSSEIGVRKAFGARRGALVGQFVVENVVLTVLGGLVGLVLAGVVLVFINRSGLIPHAQLAINYRVFIWGLFLSVVFGLVSGVYPAWRMARLHPVEAIRGRSR